MKALPKNKFEQPVTDSW